MSTPPGEVFASSTVRSNSSVGSVSGSVREVAKKPTFKRKRELVNRPPEKGEPTLSCWRRPDAEEDAPGPP